MSYSGTPTVIWRRTGEICLVAPEFCMLTEWPLEDLVGNGRKKYIYEVRNRSMPRLCPNYVPPSYLRTNLLWNTGRTSLLTRSRTLLSRFTPTVSC
jgi:hypothetical protein